MDYFKQRRAYRNFKLYEADVSMGQNNLYRELLDYANDEGKLDGQFPMKNSALVSLTGLSEDGLSKARNKLVQNGLIDYVKGRKNQQMPQYRIIKLYDKQSGKNKDNNTSYPTITTPKSDSLLTDSRTDGRVSVGQKAGQPVGQTVQHKELTSTDSDLTRPNEVVVGGSSVEFQAFELWENLWGFPNAIAREDISHWLDDFGDDLVCFAIKYAAKRNVKAKGADNYLERVFTGYKSQQIDTVAKAEAALEKHQQQAKSNYSPNQQPIRKETLPAWAEDGYKAPKQQVTAEQRAALNARLAKLQEGAKS